MAEIIIPYKPREYFNLFHNTGKRWIVIVAHRRSGKTTACLNHLQRDALHIPQSRFAYIAPTYKQAKNIAWDMLKQYSRNIPNIEYNETELTVKYPNKSKLTLYGADNPDSLRGLGLWGVVFDEYSQQPSNIFTEIIRPALSDHSGYAVWIGTPKGKNEFYRLHQHGKQDNDWLSMFLTADDTNVILKEELEDASKIMSNDEFNQEFMCSFEASVRGSFYASEIAEARKKKRIKTVAYDQALKVHTVWDLGVSDSTSIGFYQRVSTEMRMIDYYESSDKGLPHYIAKLQNKGYVYGKHFAPHDIKVRELSSGKSRLEIARGLGIEFEIVPNLPVSDGINAGRLIWNKLWVDKDKCQLWLDYISQYRREWDDKKGMFKDNPLHDFTSHAADVHRYMAIVEEEMSNEEMKPYKQKPHNPSTEYEGGVDSESKDFVDKSELAQW